MPGGATADSPLAGAVASCYLWRPATRALALPRDGDPRRDWRRPDRPPRPGAAGPPRVDAAMLKPSVQVKSVDGVLVAEFWDCLRLDLAPIQELRSLFEFHVRQKGRPLLAVDLCGVSFAGSAALGVFLHLLRLCRQHDGAMAFCRVEPTVFEAFRISKLDTMFSFAADLPAALALLTADPDGPPSTEAPAAPRLPAGPPPLRRRRPE